MTGDDANMSDTYRPGDVANGHYMDDDNKWVRLEARDPIPESRITTLPTIPRYRVTATIAPVRALGRTPWSAGAATGYGAMKNAFDDMAETAGNLGADAVVGLTMTGFAASAGGVRGDGVCVIFMGTAVKLEYIGH